MKEAEKLAFVVERLSEYHLARFRALSEIYKIVILEIYEKDNTYEWDIVEKSCLPFRVVTIQKNTKVRLSSVRVMLRLWSSLLRERANIIFIPGWSEHYSILSLAYAKLFSASAIVLSDSTEHDFKRYVWKENIKKLILKFYDAAFVAGQRQSRYLVKLGFPLQKISQGYDVVDNSHFESPRGSRPAVFARFGLDFPTKLLMTVCRLEEKKNIETLIKAFSLVRALRHLTDVGLVIVGNGSDRVKLEKLVEVEGLTQFVMFAGFRQYHELPWFYHAASVFILPSYSEQWGLVVNEAMASGLPVIVSENCGCGDDLVFDGVNGYSFDPNDAEELAEKIFLSLDPERNIALSNSSGEIISSWNLARHVEGVRNCLQTVGYNGF